MIQMFTLLLNLVTFSCIYSMKIINKKVNVKVKVILQKRLII